MNKTVANITTAVGNIEKETKTFASDVRSAVKPAVIIKPKESSQHSADTINDIRSKVNYEEIDECDVRNVSGSGIAINCGFSISIMRT